MSAFVAELTTIVKGGGCHLGKRPIESFGGIIAAMATKKPKPRELQITAWFQHLGVGDAEIAQKIGVLRETVWRWRKEPWRLDPQKIQQLANALGIMPAQLWYPPTRESLDAMLDDASDETRKMAADIVRRMVQK